ncbi:nuclease-related domain-containing protein [Bacillus sp. EB600]|uniref:nuclease-related domain-containing protein n=1 Tax=Bacillus sp. EB600 TaxID=2806345 RepID=UPI002108A1E9|nr:nuclease-related domain-containing protein [Bacillus sp. EB600]MCQ6278215.1 NERD domain-containing protein [Bacillus sp. EB600]
MAFKSRTESKELKLLRTLNLRIDLPVKDSKNYHNLEKGYKGEQKFDELLAPLPNNWLTVNDLLLKSDNNYFQVDSILIFQGTIHLINVKNYEGDYYIEKDRWYSTYENEIKNPLDQLKRSEILFKKLLQEYGFKFSVESYLIFVNPGFYLYNAPRNLPAFFPTQLQRYMDKIISIPSKLTDRHVKLAEKLVSLHLTESPFTQCPDYHYEKLKKGITCVSCHSFIAFFKKNIVICDKCGCKENVESAVLRSVNEFILLFPDRKVTVSAISDWCKILSRKTIRRILSQNFKYMGCSSSSFYVKDGEIE